jgi:mono/diheme cytochrome c family protein
MPGAQAQSDAAKVYKANCDLCHGADGSGDTGPGKAFHAKDLRSEEVQKQSDAALNEVITKGRGKMPAFGGKIHPDGVTQLVAYIRSLPPKK